MAHLKDDRSGCTLSCSSSGPEIPASHECPVCNQSGDKLCQGCFTVYYCSVEHQKSHWKSHKSQCCPYIVKESPELGRHLVAARNLQPGVTIIKELPIAYSPRIGDNASHDNAFLYQEDKTPYCLTCCKKMIGKENNVCSKCKWPICGLSCAKAKEHADNECAYFRQNKIKYQYRSSFSTKNQVSLGLIFRGILILRTLLKKKEGLYLQKSNIWSKHLINLQWERDDKSNVFNLDKQNWEFLKTFFKLSSNKLSDFDEWNKLNGIIEVNSYSIERVEMNHEEPSQVQILFLKSSLLSHSCVPNCSWGVAYSPNFAMQVRSAKFIGKGQVISVSYNQAWNYYGTSRRKEMIIQTAGFYCSCERCADESNTELGTFMSAMKCTREKCPGYLLHEKEMKSSLWKCKNSKCSNQVSDDSIKDAVHSIEVELNRLQSVCSSLPSPLMGLALIDDFSQRYSNVLHPNHWICQQIARYSIGVQGRQLLKLDLKSLNQFLQKCNYLLTIYDVLAPGISLDRALLQMYLSRAWYLVYCENFKQNSQSSQSEKLKILTKINNLQKESWLYWKSDIQTKQLQEDVGFEGRALQSEMTNIVMDISNLK